MIKHGGSALVKTASGKVLHEKTMSCLGISRMTEEQVVIPPFEEVWIWVGRGSGVQELRILLGEESFVSTMYTGSYIAPLPANDFVKIQESNYIKLGSRMEAMYVAN